MIESRARTGLRGPILNGSATASGLNSAEISAAGLTSDLPQTGEQFETIGIFCRNPFSKGQNDADERETWRFSDGFHLSFVCYSALICLQEKSRPQDGLPCGPQPGGLY